MSEPAKVTAARIDVEKRRAALIEVVRELQVRLQPATLAGEAWEMAKNKGADIAEGAVDAVRSRPMAVGGVAAAIAMFLVREPIKDAAVKIYDAMTSSHEAKPARAALKTSEQPASSPARKRARPAKRATRKTETVQ